MTAGERAPSLTVKIVHFRPRAQLAGRGAQRTFRMGIDRHGCDPCVSKLQIPSDVIQKLYGRLVAVMKVMHQHEERLLGRHLEKQLRDGIKDAHPVSFVHPLIRSGCHTGRYRGGRALPGGPGLGRLVCVSRSPFTPRLHRQPVELRHQHLKTVTILLL